MIFEKEYSLSNSRRSWSTDVLVSLPGMAFGAYLGISPTHPDQKPSVLVLALVCLICAGVFIAMHDKRSLWARLVQIGVCVLGFGSLMGVVLNH